MSGKNAFTPVWRDEYKAVCSEPGRGGPPLVGPLRCTMKRLITGRAARSREPCQKWEDRLSIREQVCGVESWWKMEKLNIPTERTGIRPELVRSRCSGQCKCVWCWSQDWFWTDPHCVCSPAGSSEPRPAVLELLVYFTCSMCFSEMFSYLYTQNTRPYTLR